MAKIRRQQIGTIKWKLDYYAEMNYKKWIYRRIGVLAGEAMSTPKSSLLRKALLFSERPSLPKLVLLLLLLLSSQGLLKVLPVELSILISSRSSGSLSLPWSIVKSSFLLFIDKFNSSFRELEFIELYEYKNCSNSGGRIGGNDSSVFIDFSLVALIDIIGDGAIGSVVEKNFSIAA